MPDVAIVGAGPLRSGLPLAARSALGGIQLNGHGHHCMWATVFGMRAAREPAEALVAV